MKGIEGRGEPVLRPLPSKSKKVNIAGAQRGDPGGQVYSRDLTSGVQQEQ
jgi:hypothetical protein